MTDSINENMSVLPPMTNLEISIIKEWCQPENEEFTVISLMNVIRVHLNNAPGDTYVEKIKNLDFTAVDNSKFNNPFVQIITMFYIRQLAIDENNGKDKKDIDENIVKFWNEFLEYINFEQLK